MPKRTMLFKAKEQPKLQEARKVIGGSMIRKAQAVCELEGKDSQKCKDSWKDLGIEVKLNE